MAISGTNCFTGYDGNGNITVLVNAADKSLAARYEYSPYGELLRETGLLARQNPFRFSSKFWDEESGLVYYGFRYYSPTFGKWMSRDITGERNSLNLYSFLCNSSIEDIDTLGDSTWLSTQAATGLCIFALELSGIHKEDGVYQFEPEVPLWLREQGEREVQRKIDEDRNLEAVIRSGP